MNTLGLFCYLFIIFILFYFFGGGMMGLAYCKGNFQFSIITSLQVLLHTVHTSIYNHFNLSSSSVSFYMFSSHICNI